MLALYGRPDTWNWLLLFHVLAAFLLVGGLLTVTMAGFAATRTRPDRELQLHRIAFFTNLLLVLPAIVAIHILGSALADREFPGDNEPDWVGIGFALATFSFVFAILLAAWQYWTLRRSRRGSVGWPAQVAAYVAAVVLIAQLVSVFVMTGKPG